MSIIKSFSVGNGDTFYIDHNSDNFTIIDICNFGDDWQNVLEQIKTRSSRKGVHRFISTHPDLDHISGLTEMSSELPHLNFYCVKNKAAKDETEEFITYRKLHNGENVFYLESGGERKWMNISDNERLSSGIDILWPILSNDSFESALKAAENGESPNDISPIITYSEGGSRVLWMGDMTNEFMLSIIDEVELPQVDILFAPHHGRESGRVPSEWLEKMDPQVIVVGEAESENLHYYPGYNTLTQNSAGHITFDCGPNRTDVYVSNKGYSVKFLTNAWWFVNQGFGHGTYIGSFTPRH